MSEVKGLKFTYSEWFNFDSYSHFLEVDVQEKRVAAGKPWCAEYNMDKALQLKMNLRNTYDGSSQEIQVKNDDKMPFENSCGGHYSVAQILRHKDALVFIVGYSRPGFEGLDSRFMAVTKIFNPESKL